MSCWNYLLLSKFCYIVYCAVVYPAGPSCVGGKERIRSHVQEIMGDLGEIHLKIQTSSRHSAEVYLEYSRGCCAPVGDAHMHKATGAEARRKHHKIT